MFRCLLPWRCNRQVEYIDRRHANLVFIPDEIYRYERYLQELYLDANQIKDLPRAFFRLYNLTHLGISDNEIARLPPEIGNLTNLEEFDISRNDICDVPENIKFCKALVTVDFSGNPLSRLPDGFTQLKCLTSLCLNDVSLVRLPPDIGSLAELQVLELRENLIKFIPVSLSFLTKLERLDLGCNELEDLPDIIGSLPELVELWLDGNLLRTLPMEIGNLKRLQIFDCSENRIEYLPDEINGLSALTDFHLSQNLLEIIPDTIGELKQMQMLKVDQNRLIQLTDFIGGATTLTELVLTDNLLEELPSSIGKLINLSVFNIDRNQLQILPVEIGNCSSLSVLSMRENFLTRLPSEIGNCRNLHVLDVSGNRMENLPLTIGTLPLKALWLSENQSKPILKLQTEDDERTNTRVLTCFLLPQTEQQFDLEDYDLDENREDFHFEPRDKPPVELGFVNEHVRFSDEESDHDEDRLGDFIRHDTPHPKDLKGRHPKMFSHKPRSDSMNSEEERRRSKGLESGSDTEHDRPRKAGVRIQDPEPAVRIQEQPAVIEDEKEALILTPTIEVPQESSPFIEGGEHNEEPSSDEGEDGERTVGFLVADDEDTEERFDSKLKRTNTPHYTKGKRLYTDKEDIQEKFHEIMAKVGQRNEDDSDEQRESGEEGEHSRDDEDGERPPSAHLNGINGHLNKDGDDHFVTVTKIVEEITYTLVRNGAGLGINIAGGKGSTPYRDNDEGVFISRINEKGPVGRDGVLQPGDKLISVNDVDISEASHNEAVQVLSNAGDTVKMVILRETEELADAVTENGEEEPKVEPSEVPNKAPKEVKKSGVRFAAEPEMEEIETATETETIVLSKRDNKGLGFSIAGGRGSTPYKGTDQAIFISKLAPGGTAELDRRLNIGDKVLSINRKSVANASHEEAVALLTSSYPSVTLVVTRERVLEKRMTPLSKHREDSLINKRIAEKELIQDAMIRASAEDTNHVDNDSDDEFDRPKVERVELKKGNGPLGFSVVGGSDHACHPFGIDEPGLFISKIVPNGAAANTNLRVGDRILAVNGKDMTRSTHHDAVTALISNVTSIKMLVRHDPPPPGLMDITIMKNPGEKLGISIRGGAKGHPGNPLDTKDEGIFISKVNESGAAAKDKRLHVGQRILEVNGTSLLGATHMEAVRSLRSVGDRLSLVVADGYDVSKVEAMVGVISNPLAAGDSLSSPDEHKHFGYDSDRSSVRVSLNEKEMSKEPPNKLTNADGEVQADGIITRSQTTVPETRQAPPADFHLPLNNSIKTPPQTANSPSSLGRSPSGSLTPSEQRALDAEKRAAWRQARMRELEEDALKAQVVIAQVKAMSATSLEGTSLSDEDRKIPPTDHLNNTSTKLTA
ncbi:protein scribble homolog isoform X2 [Dendronephthya gigantea]|uniref:protein scribble homolog isoform X2 n=1 Tax=Dendronephthya gigantea TaxID=151771 RepID=UPI00106D62BC|nr:protein scribble homolog isoform X2 [Dendronephthya gigantea]